MPSIIHAGPASAPRPRKGINAQVLVDGFSPGPARDIFNIEREMHLLADYLLERDRGFSRIRITQSPDPEFILICSTPLRLDQYRLAFGMSLLEDVRVLGGRMGFRLHMEGRTAGRFVQPAEPPSCIRFLEAIEGVDDLEIRFRYREHFSNLLVRGSISI
ncbi:MAG TPA: hypothetical protein VLD37_05055 [Candidatus Bilamarchaeum sp.]|nr:hypothetical protein [Candidatus Bilamarchaeum sp.]